MIEPWFKSLKYERLYRHDIEDGLALGERIEDFLEEFNGILPHEAINWQRPPEHYLQDPEHSNPTDPKTEQGTSTRTPLTCQCSGAYTRKSAENDYA